MTFAEQAAEATVKLIREREEAIALAEKAASMVEKLSDENERLTRWLDRNISADEATEYALRVVIEQAEDAPNCWERDAVCTNTKTGVARKARITVQWDDGKSVHELLAEAREEIARVTESLDESNARISAQSAMLTGVANALRGPPAPLARHSHHDLDLRVERVIGERDSAQHMLGELLARIHRDGGHYATEHGLAKATTDADSIVCGMLDAVRERDAMRAIVVGSTTTPTRREFIAAWGWLHGDGHHRFRVVMDYADVENLHGGRWWALGSNGAPCARPVVDGGHDVTR